MALEILSFKNKTYGHLYFGIQESVRLCVEKDRASIFKFLQMMLRKTMTVLKMINFSWF